MFGEWVWWLYLLVRSPFPYTSQLKEAQVPGFGIYKLFNTVRPLLGMFLPGIFGPGAPQAAQQQATEDVGEKGESKKQAKLRARMEKGDKRVQQRQPRQ